LPHFETQGGRIWYEAIGDGDPVLLIMGLAGKGSDWTPEFLHLLARYFRCITYDHRGCGASDPARERVTIDSMAEDALALLDHLGVGACHVAGLSMGGMIAQTIAIRSPERVRKLVLISTHCGGERIVTPDPEIMELISNPKPGRAALRRTIQALCAPGFAERRPGALEGFVDGVLASPTSYEVLQAQLKAVLSDDRYKLLPRIQAPTLIIQGDKDRLVPPGNAGVLHERIPDTRLAGIANCGHMVMLEWPEKLAELIAVFLMDTPAPAERRAGASSTRSVS